MERNDWDATDLSAYLDGQLDPEKRAALEADLARDLTLRKDLDALRQTAALIREELPLREVPRNYILTPSMVDERKVAPAGPRHGWSNLAVMRLATALSAAAFVIAVGVQLNPGRLFFAASSMPQAENGGMLLQEDAAVEEFEEQVFVAEAPTEAEVETVEEEMPAEEALPMAALEATPLPELEGATPGEVPVWDEGAVPPGLGGMGGGMLEEPEPERAAPAPEICGVDGAACDPVTAPPARELAPPVEKATGEEAAVVESLSEEEADVPLVESVEPQVRWLPWLAVLLGVCTLGLGAKTWWLARHR